MRWLFAAMLVVVAAASASAVEPRHRGPSTFVIVHDIPLPGDREAVRQRLAEHVGSEVQVEWLDVGEFAAMWPTGFIDVHGAEPERCKGATADAESIMQLGERAYGLMGLGRVREAQRRARDAEARWACLDEYVPEATLQRSALATAWAASVQGQRQLQQQALRQAAVISPTLPQQAAEELPARLQEAFHEAVDDTRRLRRWQLEVTAGGAPVDAYVDGRLLARSMGSGGQGFAEMDLLPGRHLVQYVRSGPRAESIAFELDSKGGTVRMDVATPVRESEVLQVFERSLAHGEIEPLFAGLLAAHPTSSPHDHVVLAHADHRHGQLQLRLLPLRRSGRSSYPTDVELAEALEITLDQASTDTPQPWAPDAESRTASRPWKLDIGASAGPARINGFTHGVFAAELRLQSPVLIGLELRPEISFTRDQDHTFVTGGAAAYLALRPQVKRVRFGVGIGALLRKPDHRFVGTRVLPAAELGIGLRPFDSLWISVDVDFTIHTVYDLAVRLAVTREFEFRRRAVK